MSTAPWPPAGRGRRALPARETDSPAGGAPAGRAPEDPRPCILDPMPDEAPKRLIVVGDRVLIAPEEGEERTNVGLYLPPTAVVSRQALGGRVGATGTGAPMTVMARMLD